nr:hypothetical protein [Tanacetum cinerariifolium]
SADVARRHDGDGGGDDRPPPYQVPTGCGGWAPESPIWVAAERAGCIPAKRPGTSRELVRELPLHYPSWRQMPPERKAGVVEKIEKDIGFLKRMGVMT